MRKLWLLILLVALLLCSGCWDKKEINELAIVTTFGIDREPSTGMYTAYYQVINPPALSSRQGGGSKASVYTYRFKEYSLGRFMQKTATMMPRLLFTSHLQCYILSEEVARQGIIDILNYLETTPEWRMNVYLFVTDSPLKDVMNSFTTLEKVPGRHATSLVRILSRGSFTGGVEPIRVKDIVTGMEFQLPTLIPMIHYRGKPADTTERMEQIDVSEQAPSFFADSAVFSKGRMVGHLDSDNKYYYHILNTRYRKFTETVQVGGSYIDVETNNVQVKRKWNRSANHLNIYIHADLRILNNTQNTNLSLQNIQLIEKAFNRVVADKSEKMAALGKRNNWDLLGLQDEGATADTWRQTSVKFSVTSDVTTTGNKSDPYTIEGKEG
ncbi:Ger(x)C family spore germination protein [Paenibacillus lignilyticus]|uniref:Ger(X)C family spore germination protein n=1 Tax=Paenibacillus lignilyticus TaxID=1172615 RepID=A0ABS5CAK0_9BACL|nr:Ger(x)C family spore germination protein [Paenibacillus lignilyticus]MBP3963017.1 Ger(x)C family spore germination protein [Paenibacillus lignilyticus]